jgi:hypothetical protein
MLSYLPNEISFTTQSLLGVRKGMEERKLSFTITKLSTVGKKRQFTYHHLGIPEIWSLHKNNNKTASKLA